MTDVAVPARMSTVPSPQLTVIPVTDVVLDTVKVTVMVWPVLAGLGDTLLIVTVGARGAVTVSEVIPEPCKPLLSVAVTVTVKVPPDP